MAGPPKSTRRRTNKSNHRGHNSVAHSSAQSQTQSNNIYTNLSGVFQDGECFREQASKSDWLQRFAPPLHFFPVHGVFAWDLFLHPIHSIMRAAHQTADGEYNAHLTERFGNAAPRSQRNLHVPDDNIPESVPTRINDDIRKYFEAARKPVAGAGDWLDKPEIPHPNEILRAEPIPSTHAALIDINEGPRPKRVQGPYDSTEDYLRTEYELLREDALRPLREAVAEVRKDAWKDEAQYDKSVGIYEPVYITSLIFSPRGLATRVAFSMSRVKKHVR